MIARRAEVQLDVGCRVGGGLGMAVFGSLVGFDDVRLRVGGETCAEGAGACSSRFKVESERT